MGAAQRNARAAVSDDPDATIVPRRRPVEPVPPSSPADPAAGPVPAPRPAGGPETVPAAAFAIDPEAEADTLVPPRNAALTGISLPRPAIPAIGAMTLPQPPAPSPAAPATPLEAAIAATPPPARRGTPSPLATLAAHPARFDLDQAAFVIARGGTW